MEIESTEQQRLLGQMEFGWSWLFWSRMEGLTDEEYLWEPVPACWTVHAEGYADDWPEEDGPPDPAPFTTIAWRMWHLNTCFTERWMNHFGPGGYTDETAPVAMTAEEGLENLRFAYERWRDAVRSAPASRMTEPCGPTEGRFADQPFATLVLHLNRELHHHSAECGLLRDLYLHMHRAAS